MGLPLAGPTFFTLHLQESLMKSNVMYLLGLAVCLLTWSSQAYTQTKSSASKKLVTVKAEVLLEVDRSMSIKQAEQLALQMAKEKALADRFGTFVYRGNQLYIESQKSEDGLEETNRFESLSNSIVKGIWLKTIYEKLDPIIDKEGNTWIKAQVKGKARALIEPPIRISAIPLDCPDSKCMEYDFTNEESFFLDLTSPINGYVAVYLAMADYAQCILPYPDMDPATQWLEGDQQTILFSEKEAPDYMMFTEKENELNILYVLFSKTPFGKPVLQEAEQTYGYHLLPNELPIDQFQLWLSDQQIQDSNLSITRIPITVTKR